MCDNCGAAKREANHWFVVAGFSEEGVLRVSKWSESRASAEAALHLCGERCLTTVVGNFANGQELVQKPAHRSRGAGVSEERSSGSLSIHAPDATASAGGQISERLQ